MFIIIIFVNFPNTFPDCRASSPAFPVTEWKWLHLLSCFADHPPLHAQVSASRPRHQEGLQQRAVPQQARAQRGRSEDLQLPWDRVHHRHRLPEPAGTNCSSHLISCCNSIALLQPWAFKDQWKLKKSSFQVSFSVLLFGLFWAKFKKTVLLSVFL